MNKMLLKVAWMVLLGLAACDSDVSAPNAEGDAGTDAI